MERSDKKIDSQVSTIFTIDGFDFVIDKKDLEKTKPIKITADDKDWIIIDYNPTLKKKMKEIMNKEEKKCK